MKNNVFHVKLIEEISSKIPQRHKMVNVLTTLLGIEKEAVYRRLRGEVPFSFNEVATISKRLSVSIDELVNITSENIAPCKIRLMEFAEPKSYDFAVMEQLMKFIGFINNPGTEACESTNGLPKGLYFEYESLIRFYIFKWSYQYGGNIVSKRYSDIIISPEMKNYYDEYLQATGKIGVVRYVLDFKLFEYLANDLAYFNSINMITDEEVNRIKEDLLEMLCRFEHHTTQGHFSGTQNRLQVYVSNLNFDTTYSYVQTTTYHISFIKAFVLNMVVSFDKKTYDRVRSWIQSQIKCSTLISESGEMDRIRFFDTQKKIIEKI